MSGIPSSLPPQSSEAEMGALGEMLLNPGALAEGVRKLSAEDFYLGKHRLIFETMERLHVGNRPANLLTVTATLQEIGKLDQAGGVGYVAGLPNAIPSVGLLLHYIEILTNLTHRRKLLTLGQHLQRSAASGTGVDSSLAEVRAALNALEQREASEAAGSETPDLGSLLTDVVQFLRRFVVFASHHQVVACSLWVAHTHASEAADATPYLAITSPEKQSGKTRNLEVLELLVARPWRAIFPSEAVLFRKIAADRPTLLLDEVDAIFRDKTAAYEGLRALLNAGNRRGDTVSRCVTEGKTIRIEAFPVFGPKAIAGIGNLPDTVADRSIPIRLARRARHEDVERFRRRNAGHEAGPLRDGLAKWVGHHIDALRVARPEIPDSISDRAADGWEPLLAIADLAGGDWPRMAREAAVMLHGDPLVRQDTDGVALLCATRDIFEERGIDRLATSELVKALVERDSEPWAGWWGKAVQSGDARSPGHRLSRLLRRYGVISKTIRTDDGRTAKGYLLGDFQDTFSRYLPPEERNNVTPQAGQGVPLDPRTSHENSNGTLQPLQDKACDVVTLSETQEGTPGPQVALTDTTGPTRRPIDFPPDDEGRRLWIVAMARLFSFPWLDLGCGETIGPGERAWQTLCTSPNDGEDRLGRVVAALHALDAASDGAR